VKKTKKSSINSELSSTDGETPSSRKEVLVIWSSWRTRKPRECVSWWDKTKPTRLLLISMCLLRILFASLLHWKLTINHGFGVAMIIPTTNQFWKSSAEDSPPLMSSIDSRKSSRKLKLLMLESKEKPRNQKNQKLKSPRKKRKRLRKLNEQIET